VVGDALQAVRDLHRQHHAAAEGELHPLLLDGAEAVGHHLGLLLDLMVLRGGVHGFCLGEGGNDGASAAHLRAS
jgi:hypothetical protein